MTLNITSAIKRNTNMFFFTVTYKIKQKNKTMIF